MSSSKRAADEPETTERKSKRARDAPIAGYHAILWTIKDADPEELEAICTAKDAKDLTRKVHVLKKELNAFGVAGGDDFSTKVIFSYADGKAYEVLESGESAPFRAAGATEQLVIDLSRFLTDGGTASDLSGNSAGLSLLGVAGDSLEDKMVRAMWRDIKTWSAADLATLQEIYAGAGDYAQVPSVAQLDETNYDHDEESLSDYNGSESEGKDE